LLRTWEARYQLVTPTRGDGGQRLYSAEDVAILSAVQTLIGRGHSVGEVASWPRPELLRAGRAAHAPPPPPPSPAPTSSATVQATLVLERDGIIAIASPSVESVLGWPHGLLVGQPIWGFLIDASPELESALLGNLRGRTLKVLAMLRNAAGGSFVCEVGCGAGRGSGGGTRVTVTLQALGRADDPTAVARHQAIKAALRLSARASSDVLGALALRTADDQGAVLSRIWVYDADKGELRLVASAGGSLPIAKSSRAVIKLATYPFKVGLVARSQIPFVHNELEGDRHFDMGWVRREKLESAAVLPVVEKGELLGVSASFFRRPLTGVDLAELQASLDACRFVMSAEGRDLTAKKNRSDSSRV
jgi:autonomous glycyl radical cofactor GrcA